MSRRAALLFLALGVVWGIPYLLIKVAIDELSPAQLVLARTGLAALILLPVALAQGAVRPVLRRWRWLLLFAVVEIAVPWVLLGSAETRLPSSTTGLLVAAVPLAGLVIAFVTGRAERLAPVAWLGVIIGIVGVTALVGLDIGGSDLGAVAEVGVVVIGYAAGPAILSRPLQGLPGIGIMSSALTVTAVVYVPIVLVSDGVPGALPSAKVVWSVVALAVVCTAAAFMLLFALVNEVGPVRATTITYLNPAVAVVAGAVILNEPVTVWTVVGFALVVTGSYLVNRGGRPHPPAETELVGETASSCA
ncbi:MAG TPA: DMT family transporter [Nocardioides sp.]|nr:DMT family transporter [Nocardioides sp.]